MKSLIDVFVSEVSGRDAAVEKSTELWANIRSSGDIVGGIESNILAIEAVLDYPRTAPGKDTYASAACAIFIAVGLREFRNESGWKEDGEDQARELLRQLDDKRTGWVAHAARQCSDALWPTDDA